MQVLLQRMRSPHLSSLTATVCCNMLVRTMDGHILGYMVSMVPAHHACHMFFFFICDVISSST